MDVFEAICSGGPTPLFSLRSESLWASRVLGMVGLNGGARFHFGGKCHLLVAGRTKRLLEAGAVGEVIRWLGATSGVLKIRKDVVNISEFVVHCFRGDLYFLRSVLGCEVSCR
jgi:hypothetical protein